MKNTVIKTVSSGIIITVLVVIGYLGGYCITDWLNSWKRKNTRIIVPRYERPEIRDRNGTLLIGNRVQTQPNERLRYAAIDGKFAAGLLGFTEFNHGREIGKSGIEKMIDRKQVPGNPVFVSIDGGIQRIVENWMERLSATGKNNYIYAICLNSQGELIATAQRPVLDINNRQQVEGGTFLLPSVYVFPVSDDFMKLLGSSIDATSEEKEKFRFHHKIGVLSPEARGRVRGINASADAPDAQTATAFNYLLAYISIAEKKPIPQLQIFSSGKQPPMVMKNKIEWIKVQQGENNIVALGTAPELNGNWLYFLLCIAPDKQAYAQSIASEIQKF